MTIDRTFSFGILGTGRIAAKFASKLPCSRTERLVATGSRFADSAGAFASIHGGAAVTSYDALLARDDIETVYLSLPNALHRERPLTAIDAALVKAPKWHLWKSRPSAV